MKTTRDLGTYHLRVVFTDGRGYIERWDTGMRFTGGTTWVSPLNATPMKPVWESEEDLVNTILFAYLDGNSSCECNRLDNIARANGEDDPDNECGETLELASLTIIGPDGSERGIYP